MVVFAFKTISTKFAEGSKAAVAGSLLASVNTATEYGFGAVIAALPGFIVIKGALQSIPNPLVNEAITVTTLAGVTGSASGGMSIALAAMSTQFIAAANAAGIPLEVLHRVAAMASGGNGHIAAQWRRHHASGGDGVDPSAILYRHFRHHLHQDDGLLRGHSRLLSDRARLIACL